MEIKRAIHKRGNSWYSGIPFYATQHLEKGKKYHAIWTLNPKNNAWEVEFKER
ncbi:MAG: hypothetical protein ABIH20_06130 [Candidatus Diapherotrites archaeon]